MREEYTVTGSRDDELSPVNEGCGDDEDDEVIHSTPLEAKDRTLGCYLADMTRLTLSRQ